MFPAFFVRQVISYCLNDIEGESGYFNCGGNNQELLLHAKTVPAGVREFIDLRSGKAPISNTPGKNPKLSPSSAVGTTPSPEVKQDEGR